MSYERFARQYRFEPPSGFPLTSPCTSIVHHLSGPSIYALARHRAKATTRCPGCALSSRGPPIIELSPHPGFDTLVLAHMLDSLVRVSRRVGSHRADAPSWHRQPLTGRGRARGVSSVQGAAQNHPHGRSQRGVLLARPETMVRTGFGQAEARQTASTIRLLPTISRTISLSFQSPFHLSLTVLVRYRSPTNI